MTASIRDVRDLLKVGASAATSADQKADAATRTAADAEAKATTALAMAQTTRLDLGVKTVTFNSVVSAVLATRRLTILLPAALLNDRVVAHKASIWPVGYAILGPAFVAESGKVEVDILTPLLTALQLGSVSLSFQFFALRSG